MAKTYWATRWFELNRPRILLGPCGNRSNQLILAERPTIGVRYR